MLCVHHPLQTPSPSLTGGKAPFSTLRELPSLQLARRLQLAPGTLALGCYASQLGNDGCHPTSMPTELSGQRALLQKGMAFVEQRSAFYVDHV